MKRVWEFLAICFIMGELLTIYTLIGCVRNGEPFPPWFRAAWWFYCGVFALVLVGAAALLAVKGVRAFRRRFRQSRKFRRFCGAKLRRWRYRRRFGMVRIEPLTGKIYYERRWR